MKTKENSLLKKSSIFLQIHGILFILIGSVFIAQVLIGLNMEQGVMSFLHTNPMAAIGFFEAYSLATVCGIMLVVFSKITYHPGRHLAAALVDLPLLLTNILFWDFYHQFDMVSLGIGSTVMHIVFISLELFLYYQTKKLKV